MLTKEDANAIADSIVHAAKSDAEEVRESKARGAPVWLRVQGISSLPKRTQDEIVRDAIAATRKSLLIRTIAISWGLLCFIGWQLAAPVADNYMYIALLLPFLGVAAIFTAGARRRIRAKVINLEFLRGERPGG